MNLLKDNPKFVTFLLLVITLIYCAQFTRSISCQIIDFRKGTTIEMNERNKVKASIGSFTGTVNDFADHLSERIEQAIRQTSHLIGS